MTHVTAPEPQATNDASATAVDVAPPRRHWVRTVFLGLGVLIIAVAIGGERLWQNGDKPAASSPLPPQVTVSRPLEATVGSTTSFLGQFSAVDSVEVRAQVGGTLSAISFHDGQIVRKDDLLFVIDPRPFQVRLDQAMAQLQIAQAKQVLAGVQLRRAQDLKQSNFGTAENVDQRAADEREAQAAIDSAKAAIIDARLDVEFSHVTAPFAGRMSSRLVSLGSLVSGSRGGSSATTLLTTIVSLDPIYLDFDMSEADYRAFRQARRGDDQTADVAISLDGNGRYDHHGVLDFIDNAVNRSSGTIRARATVPNPGRVITPGQFARLRVATGIPTPVLLIPAVAIVPDQSREMVMTVAADGTVLPKEVQGGDLHRGLRIIRGGLQPTDNVVIDGVVRARPGGKVTPVDGAIAIAANNSDG